MDHLYIKAIKDENTKLWKHIGDRDHGYYKNKLFQWFDNGWNPLIAINYIMLLLHFWITYENTYIHIRLHEKTHHKTLFTFTKSSPHKILNAVRQK